MASRDAISTPEIQKTMVITVMGGNSYDKIYTDRKYQIPERKIFQVSTEYISDIHKALLIPNTPEHRAMFPFPESLKQIYERYHMIGADKVTLNFECCSEYGEKHDGHNCFKTPELSHSAIKFMVFMLKQGAQVICADFALKALIGTWDPVIFGAECPFIQTGVTAGMVNCKFNINACKESVLPALCAIANMAVPDEDPENPNVSHITMTAISSTITYAVKKVIDPKLHVKVMSVAKSSSKTAPSVDSVTGGMTCIGVMPAKAEEDTMCRVYETDPRIEISTAYGTSIKGNPIHAEVYFNDLPGVLVVSALHLINLQEVNASTDNIIATCTAVAGDAKSSEIASQLAIAASQGPAALAAMQSECVRAVGAYSSGGYSRRRVADASKQSDASK